MSRHKPSISKQVTAALRGGQLEILCQGRAEIVPFLIEIAQGHSSLLAGRARQVLQQLQVPQAKEAVCQVLIERDLPLLLEIAREAEYRPADLSRRALFYFVTAQWEAYDALDFDRRLLRVIYQTAEPALRRRIAAKVQAAGRVDYLSIIAGNEYTSPNSSQSTAITSEEYQLILDLLAAKEEWLRLWELIPYLPLEWSIQAVSKLTNAEWQPAREEERVTFNQLQQVLEYSLLLVRQSELSQTLNQTTLRARIRVDGRVKALAFASSRPLLAIATGSCKVVLWNLQKAEREVVLEGFKYPVGSLAFLPDGTLLCGERPQTKVTDCKIYGFQDGCRFELGQHLEAVSSLQVVSPTKALSIGRNGRVILWDVIARSKLAELGEIARSWSPTLCLCPGKERLVVLHNQIELYELASPSSAIFRKLTTSSSDYTNSLKQGAFSPTGQELVTGRFNGELIVWSLNPNGLGQIEMAQQGFKSTPRPDTTVEGLLTLMNPALLLMATSDKTIQYFDWQTKTLLGEIQTPGERLSSLQLSPDETFLAVGDRDQSFSLWDLRLLALSGLFTQPLAQARPAYLSIFAVLDTIDLKLPPELVALLKFIELVLYHRFRYEIELADFALIHPGDFDIELED